MKHAWLRTTESLVTVASVIAAVTLLALLAGRLTGHETMIDRSDSMRPAIEAGDLIVSRRVTAMKAKAGDIVTFAETGRTGRTITHRVMSIERRGQRLAFTTRGDANSASESWVIEGNGTIGVTRAVVPQAGFAIDWLGRPLVRFALISFASVLLGAMALGAIWRRDVIDVSA